MSCPSARPWLPAWQITRGAASRAGAAPGRELGTHELALPAQRPAGVQHAPGHARAEQHRGHAGFGQAHQHAAVQPRGRAAGYGRGGPGASGRSGRRCRAGAASRPARRASRPATRATGLGKLAGKTRCPSPTGLALQGDAHHPRRHSRVAWRRKAGARPASGSGCPSCTTACATASTRRWRSNPRACGDHGAGAAARTHRRACA